MAAYGPWICGCQNKVAHLSWTSGAAFQRAARPRADGCGLICQPQARVCAGRPWHPSTTNPMGPPLPAQDPLQPCRFKCRTRCEAPSCGGAQGYSSLDTGQFQCPKDHLFGAVQEDIPERYARDGEEGGVWVMAQAGFCMDTIPLHQCLRQLPSHSQLLEEIPSMSNV